MHSARLAHVGFLLSLGLLSACTQQNASNPISNPPSTGSLTPGDSTRNKFWSNETSSVYVSSTDTVITGYNDLEGFGTFDPKNSNNIIPLTPFSFLGIYIGESFAGYAYSSNFRSNNGVSWKTQILEPTNPAACSSPPCPLILRGDPAMATNGKRVLYGNLAITTTANLGTNPSAIPDALAISRDETGTGAGFGAAFLAAKPPSGVFVDQPSISMLGDVALAAFDDGNTGDLYLATSDSSGTDRWYPVSTAQNLPDLSEGIVGRNHAIVKLVSPTFAYMAYLANGTQLMNETSEPTVVNLTRQPGGSVWTATPMAAFFQATMPDRAPGALSRTWVDTIPISFDIGDIGGGGAELHLVARQGESGGGTETEILHWHCLDRPVGTCNNQQAWSQEIFPNGTTATGDRFQPTVAADPTDGKSVVGITWYQEATPGSSNYYLMGVDTGRSFRAPDGPIAVTQVFSPCPDPATGSDPGRFGDYQSTIYTPVNLSLTLQGTNFYQPFWLTLFTRSTQCVAPPPGGDIVQDQFIQSTLW